MTDDEEPGADDFRAKVRWFLGTDHGVVATVREILGSVVAVLLVGLILFAVSGVWPPMVAVESGSMEPEMSRGDLVFVVGEQRFVPESAHERTGIVTAQHGKRIGYRTFGGYGDVIVYRPYGKTRKTPVIHRVRFWVNDSENWYDKANPEYLSGTSCETVPNCPAPHAGFITKGDANPQYDQAQGITSPVRPRWVRGTAELRIPYLGHVRLVLS